MLGTAAGKRNFTHNEFGGFNEEQVHAGVALL
jgi:hypothetical protein